jgi:hypothetical protein
VTTPDAETVVLMSRLLDALVAFEAPDHDHRALRSMFSRKGVCETVQRGHSPICLEWRALIVEAVAWLEQHDQPEPRQTTLFDVAG